MNGRQSDEEQVVGDEHGSSCCAPGESAPTCCSSAASSDEAPGSAGSAGEPGSAICCSIRCLDPAAVEEALGRLDPSGAERVAYTCKISGEREELLLVGARLAARLADSMPEAEDAGDAKILAGLWSAELCECDVATLTALPEARVVERLRALTATGVLGHREIQGMNYYRLESQAIRERIEETLATAGTAALRRPIR